jgi:hypothetical protein
VGHSDFVPDEAAAAWVLLPVDGVVNLFTPVKMVDSFAMLYLDELCLAEFVAGNCCRLLLAGGTDTSGDADDIAASDAKFGLKMTGLAWLQNGAQSCCRRIVRSRL